MSYLIRNSLFATILGSVSGLLLCAEPASAQTETFVTSSYLGKASHTTDFVLPSFNASLGTLDSVDLILRVNLCPEISIFNSTTAPVGFSNASIDVPVDVMGPGSLNLTMDLNDAVKTGTAQPGITNYGLARKSTDASTQVAPSDFDLWENQSNNKISIDLTPGFPTFQGTASGPGLFFGGSSTEWGRVTVVYRYTALSTPEPRGEYLTAIVGLAMLVAVLRRRKSTQA